VRAVDEDRRARYLNGDGRTATTLDHRAGPSAIERLVAAGLAPRVHGLGTASYEGWSGIVGGQVIANGASVAADEEIEPVAVAEAVAIWR
jgi:hypothetical protein